MKIISNLFFLQRIDHLIRTRATGSPEQLASRLSVSERNVYRLIKELKCQGFPIAYDKQANTYFYSEPVKLDFSIIIGPEKLLAIRGGSINTDFFHPANFWQSRDSPLGMFRYHLMSEQGYSSAFTEAL
ncbi:MAG: HTH domain-containing protein [Lewinellaceae bacterium]|nr:HTH domain-containing protein [Lewinellaceae bacterium]